ncbi:MAG: ferredoxin [Synechococcaceae bacterium WB9_4xC_028]|jgi:ferredoxin|uniref:2Fe-2S iron-sulfur cluster-binding protein n=1 Tax=unclassified Synechococcus TaxID=2626047 RepID=UPI0010390477|nr:MULTISPECIES: 2Fe-2S iron-sulfur cluster-binding protein [unclassified Synechococcus]NDD44028.1 ferredoxin [Synechococcaceae bacterium WB9_4xB_025]NDD68678.1 ferredoxin [Synechococcaceae bacterium WB9_4xC_028]QNG27269.1 2Fe-2S iron-sulfur cluster binding domain-containing protein [Synechococcus sp. HK01-R]TCD55961.1 ferredoxin [Synechococcus sp. BS56D]
MSDTTAGTYTITVELDGQQHAFQCSADQTVLAAAEAAGVLIPSSCCAGVCTTCAAQIREGEVHQPDAMGVKEELRKDGFALLCVSYPRSDLKVVAGQEDALYEAQFGQYQK